METEARVQAENLLQQYGNRADMMASRYLAGTTGRQSELWATVLHLLRRGTLPKQA